MQVRGSHQPAHHSPAERLSGTSEACPAYLHYKWILAADISSHFQETIDFVNDISHKGLISKIY